MGVEPEAPARQVAARPRLVHLHQPELPPPELEPAVRHVSVRA